MPNSDCLCVCIYIYLCSESFTRLIHEKKAGSELIGSWTVEIGDQDEAGRCVLFMLLCL